MARRLPSSAPGAKYINAQLDAAERRRRDQRQAKESFSRLAPTNIMSRGEETGSRRREGYGARSMAEGSMDSRAASVSGTSRRRRRTPAAQNLLTQRETIG